MMGCLPPPTKRTHILLLVALLAGVRHARLCPGLGPGPARNMQWTRHARRGACKVACGILGRLGRRATSVQTSVAMKLSGKYGLRRSQTEHCYIATSHEMNCRTIVERDHILVSRTVGNTPRDPSCNTKETSLLQGSCLSIFAPWLTSFFVGTSTNDSLRMSSTSHEGSSSNSHRT